MRKPGRFSGAVIQVTSNTGTTAYHGSLFFKADRPGMNAWQRWNGASSVRPCATPTKRPANRGLAKDQQPLLISSAAASAAQSSTTSFSRSLRMRRSATTRLPRVPGCLRLRLTTPPPHRRTASRQSTWSFRPASRPAATGIISGGPALRQIGVPDGPYCHTITVNGNGTM